jgi:hypothetical protein
MIDGVIYTLNNHTAMASLSSENTNPTITIPALIYISGNSYAVTEIGSFSSLSITSVTIESTSINIHHDAFKNCIRLNSILFLNKNVSIGTNAFYGCVSLLTIEIHSIHITLYAHAFRGCPLLSLTLNTDVLTIDTSFKVRQLPHLIVTTNIVNIVNFSITLYGIIYTFLDTHHAKASLSDRNITTIIIPARIDEYDVTEIGSFSDSFITSVTIESTSITIDYDAFKNCTRLTFIDFPNATMLIIGDNAFQSCTSLNTLILNATTLTIASDIVLGCTSLNTIVCNAVDLFIGTRAFYSYTSLLECTSTHVTIEIDAIANATVIFKNVDTLTSPSYSPTRLILINTTADFSNFTPSMLFSSNSNTSFIRCPSSTLFNLPTIIPKPTSTTCTIYVPVLQSTSFYITYTLNNIAFTGTITDLVPATNYSFSLKIYINVSPTIKSRILPMPSILLQTLSISFTTATPVSNICFFKDTPILTDQGTILIQSIKNHTIHSAKLILTKTLHTDSYLVRFEKDALAQTIPSLPTIMTKNHRILYKGKWFEAKRFLTFEHVHRIPYDGSVLYNVLMKSHTPLCVNNLTCESLSPTSSIALLYGMHKQKKIKSVMSSILSL